MDLDRLNRHQKVDVQRNLGRQEEVAKVKMDREELRGHLSVN